MYLLDTNVLSALMAPAPPKQVAHWVASRPARQLHTASLCQAEILAGIAILPEGRRRAQLDGAARVMFERVFAQRVLPFDSRAADNYAGIFAMRREAGLPTPSIDLLIAAIAESRGMSVVTRNVADFAGCGVVVSNPWDEEGAP